MVNSFFHNSLVLKQSGTRKNETSLIRIASFHTSCVTYQAGTDSNNMGSSGATLLHISFTHLCSCNDQEHQETAVYSIPYICHTFSGSCTERHLQTALTTLLILLLENMFNCGFYSLFNTPYFHHFLRWLKSYGLVYHF